MPNRYDKAVCATELKLRDRIFEKVRSGWRPQHAFQVGTAANAPEGQPESGDMSETSVTSTASGVRDARINDITNLNDE